MYVRSDERRAAVWHLRAARLSMSIGQPASALVEMQRFLGTVAETGIQSSAGLRLVIDALIALERYPEALRLVELARLAFPHSVSFCVRCARIHLLMDAHDQAIELATQIMAHEQQPRRDTLVILAQAYQAQGRHADALRIYRELMPQAGHGDISSELLISYAQTCLDVEAGDEGLEVLTRIILPPVLLKARLLASAQRLSEALQIYDALLTDYGVPSSDADQTLKFILANTKTEFNEEQLLEASIERITILDRLGHLAALERLARFELDAPSEDARVRLALGHALATAGRSEIAYTLIQRERNHPIHNHTYLTVLLIIAEVEGMGRLATRIARTLSKTDRSAIIHAEQNALLAKILRGQPLTSHPTNQTTATEFASPLLGLMQNACIALTTALQDSDSVNATIPERKSAEAGQNQSHLSQCRVVLHRCRKRAALAAS